MTVYDYASDPLDRLQQIYYRFVGQPDNANPILPSFPQNYKYVSTGDGRRLFQVSMSSANGPWLLQENGYDTEGRLASTKVSYVGYPTFETDYTYNILNQLTDVTYPAEFGIAAQPR